MNCYSGLIKTFNENRFNIDHKEYSSNHLLYNSLTNVVNKNPSTKFSDGIVDFLLSYDI